jgi:outer membrane protein assembly factor BamB
VPLEEFRAGPWFWWLRSSHPDVDLLIPHGPHSSGTPRRLALLDPATGQAKWDIDWSDRVFGNRVFGHRLQQAAGSRQVRLAPTYLDRGFPGEWEAGLAGIDEADGTLLWHIAYPSVNSGGWRSPVYLGSSGRYLVLVGVPRLHDDKGRITVAVHDRLTGRLVWDVRWPDRTEPGTPVAGVADICGNIVLTLEGDFLRARRIEDGRQLWSTVPPPRYGLGDQGRAPATQWAWLWHAKADPGPAACEGKDLFIHAPTGRYLTISRAFHQTQDDLVLTHAGGMLTCLELPRV